MLEPVLTMCENIFNNQFEFHPRQQQGRDGKEQKERSLRKIGRNKLFSRACITRVGVFHRAPMVLGRLLVDESGGCYAAARTRRWNSHNVLMVRDRAVNPRDEVLERFAFLVTRRNRFQRSVALFVAVEVKISKNLKRCRFLHLLLLIKRHRVPLRPARVDRRCSHQVRQVRSTHNRLVRDRTEPRHICFAIHSHTEQSALQRVNNNQNITKLGRQDVASVVAVVLAPHDVHLVVS